MTEPASRVRRGVTHMELSGKVAIVTGGSRGIGLAITEALLARGAKVAVWSRQAHGLGMADCEAFPCDVKDRLSVQRACEATRLRFGQRIDVLVNNAGIGFSGTLADQPFAQWEDMFAVNVHGVFHCSQICLPHMDQGGHILNIASLAGKSGLENMGGYCATKFAVRGMSEAWFKELRPKGVKVTCVLPGSVETDIFKTMGPHLPPKNPLQPRDIADAVVSCLTMGGNNLISEIEVRPFQPSLAKVLL
jgi:NAD(P)-dependent dehydrogenase (short-subunit alcohol dehydrogenase family)